MQRLWSSELALEISIRLIDRGNTNTVLSINHHWIFHFSDFSVHSVNLFRVPTSTCSDRFQSVRIGSYRFRFRFQSVLIGFGFGSNRFWSVSVSVPIGSDRFRFRFQSVLIGSGFGSNRFWSVSVSVPIGSGRFRFRFQSVPIGSGFGSNRFHRFRFFGTDQNRNRCIPSWTVEEFIYRIVD